MQRLPMARAAGLTEPAKPGRSLDARQRLPAGQSGVNQAFARIGAARSRHPAAPPALRGRPAYNAEMVDPDSAMAAAARQPAADRPVVSHRAALLVLAVGGFAVFAIWQFTGVEHYLDSLAGFCM